MKLNTKLLRDRQPRYQAVVHVSTLSRNRTHVPCLWKTLSGTPALAAVDAPPALIKEWVLNAELDGRESEADLFTDFLAAADFSSLFNEM